jgi:23S rRNA pseudouridine1911/1915/1917 synthase
MISIIDFQTAISIGHQKIQKKPKTPRTFTLSIKKKYDGYTLLDVYTHSFSHVDSEFWKEKIKSRNLTVDGKSAEIHQIVRAGQITQHTTPYKPEPKVNSNIQLIHATDHFWIINKPAPLPVHAGGRYLNNTLKSLLNTSFPELDFYLINRLDANTTGLVLIALNKETAQNLNKQFQNQTVRKSYLALIEGIPINNTFSSSKAIGINKTPGGGRKIEAGKNSFTEFEILNRFTDVSLLHVTPHSGRTNQIRLHLADINLPIVGDVGYKNSQYFEKNPLTYDEDCLFLHSWKLRFIDPLSNIEIEFEAPTNKKWATYF